MKPITQISEFSSAVEDINGDLPGPAKVSLNPGGRDLYELTKPARLNLLVLATTAVGFYMVALQSLRLVARFPGSLGQRHCVPRMRAFSRINGRAAALMP